MTSVARQRPFCEIFTTVRLREEVLPEDFFPEDERFDGDFFDEGMAELLGWIVRFSAFSIGVEGGKSNDGRAVSLTRFRPENII